MTMIEKMARAIWNDREQHQNESCRQSWERGSELARQFAMDHARAALSALLEPSEGMLEAGYQNGRWDINGPKWIYVDMIQAALNEKDA